MSKVLVYSESHDYYIIPREMLDQWESTDMFEEAPGYAEYIDDIRQIKAKDLE